MKWPALVLALLGAASLAKSAEAHADHGVVVEEITQISDAIPDLELRDQFDRPLPIAATLKDPGLTTVVTFTYTRCKTLCPVVVPMAISIVRKLEEDRVPVQLVVFTVDPAHDQPADMAAHAAVLEASDEDLFVTGDPADMRQLLRFFGLTSTDPEQHPPLIISRSKGAGGYTRMIVGDRTTTQRLLAIIRENGG
jgi:cytochrome oxidase Cu insertion factor (SCO1/SenC/PrrC family)